MPEETLRELWIPNSQLSTPQSHSKVVQYVTGSGGPRKTTFSLRSTRPSRRSTRFSLPIIAPPVWNGDASVEHGPVNLTNPPIHRLERVWITHPRCTVFDGRNRRILDGRHLDARDGPGHRPTCMRGREAASGALPARSRASSRPYLPGAPVHESGIGKDRRRIGRSDTPDCTFSVPEVSVKYQCAKPCVWWIRVGTTAQRFPNRFVCPGGP